MDAGERKAFEEFRKALRETEEAYNELIDKMRNVLAALTIEDMKEELRRFGTEDLETLCETYRALENENYEICQSAQEILMERKKNNK